MTRRLLLRTAVLALSLTSIAMGLMAQGCTNTSQYPSDAIVPDAMGAVTNISTCSYQQEYSVVGPVIAGGTYTFTCTGNSYITVHEGTADGTVIANGYSPLEATATAAGNLYAHWTVDSLCTTGTGCQTTTVQLMLDCTPPTVTVTPVDDCDNNEYSLVVNVDSLGDATDVDLIYSVNGADADTVFGVMVGTDTIGPFTVGDIVDLTVAHSSDPLCNVQFNGLESGNTCPTIVECGVDTVHATYCYGPNDSNHWNYESSNGQALIMIFSAGMIESASYDNLRIYEGTDNTGNLLYEHTMTSTEDLAGLQVVAASGQIYMENSSDGSVSCSTNTGWDWVWTVQCMDCQPAVATYNVVTDCDNYEYSVEVHITDLGSDATLDISADSLGTVLATATDTGVYTVGPFTANIPVHITLQNSENGLCNVISPELVNPLCPQVITCGDPAIETTYCYGLNDAHAWHWQAASPSDNLSLLFQAGSIQAVFNPNTGDHLRIYDGPDNSAPLLFDHTATSLFDLSGLQVISTGPDIYMEMSSDGFGSCSSGATTEWDWIVGCSDCTPATATYEVVTDCDNFEYSVNVHITDLGSDNTLDISADSLGTVLATATDTGMYTVGPFTANIPVVITLNNSDNILCNVHSDPLVNPLCPTPVVCGDPPLDETYCYINNDDNAWHWVSTTGDPLIMIFSAGSIESASYDHLTIYEGPDATGTILYDHVGGAEDLTGLQVISPSGEIYMTNSSDGSVSCESGSQDEWVWQVGCLDCNPATATYEVVTDCDNYEFNVIVHITDLGSDNTLDISADSLGTVLATATDTGMYTVGPFTANIPVVITLNNSDNVLCSVHSDELVNPICPQIITCGDPVVETTYCYVVNDAHAWHWESDDPNETLSLRFLAGSIQAVFDPNTGDHLRIYDGPDNTSPLLFDHTATTLFDLTDLQVTSTGPSIYMEMSSDGFGSCGSGATTEWDWIVGCADCTAPVADYTVVTDCDNFQFSVDVDITAMGSNPVINITNTGGAPPVAATAVGTYTVGPFTANQPVVINLGDDANVLCSIHSDELVNPLCPTIVECGTDTLQETYCYINNDSHIWHWQSSAPQPLYMTFTAGTIESSTFDHLTIYDGPDDQSPVLFDHDGPAEDLTGLTFIASSGHIYMTNSSDGSVSCASGSQDEWAWTINCLDCTNPAAEFSVVDDCIHHSFDVQVDVSSLGSGNSVRIVNSFNADTLMNVPTGITMVGPFPMDTVVTVSVLNETNYLCQDFSAALTSPSVVCVDSVCAAQAYDYCYGNLDTAYFAYQGTENVPLTIEFLWGQLLADDYVQIFDGGSIAATLLWQGNLNGDMSGFAMNTTNPDHALLMRVVSSATASCATGEASPELHWVVQCGAVGVSEVPASDFAMYPNPTTGQLTIQLPMEAHGATDMRIIDVAGRTVHHETFNANGGANTFDLKDLQTGNYSVVLTTNDWVKSQVLQIIR